MNKELKAFRKICKNLNSYEFTDECSQNKKLIETALKRLKNYEQNEDFREDVLNYVFLNEQDKIKKLRALEIIKELFIFSLEFDESQNEWFLYVSNQEQYILFAKGTGIKTYDLLKEVLL